MSQLWQRGAAPPRARNALGWVILSSLSAQQAALGAGCLCAAGTRGTLPTLTPASLLPCLTGRSARLAWPRP